MAVNSTFRSKLWIVASVVWLAWAAGLAVMWFDYRWRVMHPYFLPLVGLLVIQATAGLALVVAAFWRIVRGPRRTGVVGWLLLGTAPLWLWSAHFSYGAWALYEQHAALTAPVKMTSAAVASLADLVIRFRHRHRSEGQYTVVFHDPPAMPAEQLTAMDRHIEQMEQTLGQSARGGIHWIRGEVFRNKGEPAGWYLSGLAVVIHPSAGVDRVDRHEIAHAVIDRHCDADAQPPLVLVEGWAESQSGYEPGFLASRAWRHRQRGEVLSLDELTGPWWYACGDWPVYEFGGALVEYLLDEFGGPKFLELYTTCRRQTFADDCHRVLGVDLEELDRRFWEFVERRVKEMKLSGINPLLDVKLADGVDRDAWNQFARQYPEARAALAAPLEHARFEFRGTFARNSAQPQPIRLEILRDDRRRRLTYEGNDEQFTVVASPGQSFLVRRRDSDEPWKLDLEYLHGNPFLDYCLRRTTVGNEEGQLICGGTEDVFTSNFLNLCQRDGFLVTRFEPLAGDAEGAVRLEYSNTSGGSDREPQRWYFEDSLTLLPNRHWTVREYEGRATVNDFFNTRHKRFEYGDDSLPPGVPTAVHSSSDFTGGNLRRDVTLTRSQFQPVADNAFKAETFGISAADLPHRSRAPWYIVMTTAAGVVSTLMGLALVIVDARHQEVEAGR